LATPSIAYDGYMAQFKQMQALINDKNEEIAQLTLQVKQCKVAADNFRYVAALNHEYFAIDLGDGELRYTEA